MKLLATALFNLDLLGMKLLATALFNLDFLGMLNILVSSQSSTCNKLRINIENVKI